MLTKQEKQELNELEELKSIYAFKFTEKDQERLNELQVKKESENKPSDSEFLVDWQIER
ncbi:MAG: hypothetical protein JXR30_01405 [Alphaproteobacteria bacterium]|nr:hypothetical protein [Alphaproteobacteria bacterium]